jgi:hypothetical protein
MHSTVCASRTAQQQRAQRIDSALTIQRRDGALGDAACSGRNRRRHERRCLGRGADAVLVDGLGHRERDDRPVTRASDHHRQLTLEAHPALGVEPGSVATQRGDSCVQLGPRADDRVAAAVIC